jgi:L-asparaginase II
VAADPDPIVVEVTRSGTIESTHLVDVAVVDPDGSLVSHAGDPAILAAFRSSVKPLQATVCLEQGWGADSEALAIACASHNGEPQHSQAVMQVLATSGLGEEHLRCPEAWPMRPSDISNASGQRRIAHNCSGKHAAFLATCASRGWPLETYRDATHPLQREILGRMASAMGEEPKAILVDGCGAPTPVATLTGFARGFGIVAGSDAATAMMQHPFLIGGTDRLDTALLEAGIVTKAGAEGLSCALVGADGQTLSVAIKCRDGASRARGPALALVLEQLSPGCLDGVPRKLLWPPTLGAGEPVGHAVASGKLT